MKLNSASLSALAADVRRPTYERNHEQHGIVHIGVGGFHRAHQAVYTDALLEQGESEWSICGVGLREGDRHMEKALSEQDYLYTLMELDHKTETKVQVIGAISQFLYAPDAPEVVLKKLADPSVRIVSLTITEGGYNVDDNTGQFDLENADVVHDLANAQNPITAFGYICEALARRKAAGVNAFTLMSCDNLPHNGDVAKHALLAFATARDPELAAWINKEVCFPNSMVDRITPMTNAEHIDWLSKHYDLEDQWPVICEPFTQWVIEDKFSDGRPTWENAGVQFTDDVDPYECMKLRLLNASHSAMAYLGCLAGYELTPEVMNDEQFSGFIADFMDEDVTPLLGTIEGVDLEAYKATLIERFGNQKMGDQLARLCMDGSGKIPKFILPTIVEMIAQERSLSRVALIIASWALYLRKQPLDQIQDPNAELLKVAAEGNYPGTQHFLSLQDVFPAELRNSEAFASAFSQALHKLEQDGVSKTLAALKA